MDDGVIIEMGYCYLAKVGRARSRGVFDTPVRATGEVMVRSVAGSEADIAIEARWPAGEKPTSMRWRAFEGALWRPLVDHAGEVLGGPGDFEARMRATHAEGGLKGLHDWHDYPFKLVAPGAVENGFTPFTGFAEDSPEIVLRGGDRQGAYARAQVHAADNLIMVDGVLHMRSEPPVWTVGHDMPWVAPGLVRLALADHAGHRHAMASFPLDREDDAVAFAAMHVEGVKGQEWYGRLHYERDPQVERDGSTVEFGKVALPDTRVADMVRLAQFAHDNVGRAEIRALPRAFLKAYADFGVAVDALAGAGPGQVPDIGEAEMAVASMLATADPEWFHTWPALGTAVEAVRVLGWRAEFEDGRAILDEDAQAFSGPGL